MMACSPILMRIGYGLSWQSAVVAAWGGLRGAVGLALALQVYIDHPLIGGKVQCGAEGLLVIFRYLSLIRWTQWHILWPLV